MSVPLYYPSLQTVNRVGAYSRRVLTQDVETHQAHAGLMALAAFKLLYQSGNYTQVDDLFP